MSLTRKLRVSFWFIHELFDKHRWSLLIGLSLGLAVAIMMGKLIPYVYRQWFSPVLSIGVVGEYSPTTLPLFVQKQLSMGLTDISFEGNINPALALSWQIQDQGKTYIFTLRNDLLWHNGDPVKAKDVNYNIKNVVFTPLGDHELKATLDDAYSPFLALVTKPIVTAGLRGFGPYKVMSLKLKGDKVRTLRLYPVSPNSAPVVEYRFYKTESQAILAYKLGDIDAIKELSSVEGIKDWGSVSISEHESYDQIVGLYFNHKNELFFDKSVRQALWYALPPGTREPVRTPLHHNSWAYIDKVRNYESNESQAKKLLAATKLASPGAELTISTFSYLEDIAQVIASTWTRFGITTKVKVENVFPPDYEIILSMQPVPLDPDQYPFWHSTQATNITHYANVKIDKLLEDGRKEQDQEKRKKIYADFQRYLMEDAPAIFLYYPTIFNVQRK